MEPQTPIDVQRYNVVRVSYILYRVTYTSCV
jgi:hypothetical protein